MVGNAAYLCVLVFWCHYNTPVEVVAYYNNMWSCTTHSTGKLQHTREVVTHLESCGCGTLHLTVPQKLTLNLRCKSVTNTPHAHMHTHTHTHTHTQTHTHTNTHTVKMGNSISSYKGSLICTQLLVTPTGSFIRPYQYIGYISSP